MVYKENEMFSDLEFAGYCRSQIDDINLQLARLERDDVKRPKKITITIEYVKEKRDEFTGTRQDRERCNIELDQTEGMAGIDADLFAKLIAIVNEHKEAVREEMDGYIDDYVKGRASEKATVS